MTSVNPQSLTRIRTETQNRLHLMDLGPVGNFEKFPARVEIAGRSYFLVQSGQGYSLFSMICPHKGDIVLDAGEIFECPSHGWTFDHQTGNCLNTPNARLRSLSCWLEEGHLLAEIPFNLTLETPRRAKRLAPLQDLNLTLHAHASLQLDYRGFELLLDPWLVGPTYLGSWIQFPPSLVDVDKLDPDAILITHEHSDHFHEPTLQKFSWDRRIYVPDFPNRHMVERLAALGFTNVHAWPFGERMRRYGLYCGGCHRATYETLALAGLQHGIEEVQLARLVIELNRALN
jgi:CMP-N-acetylneuraminate monooxygenase